ncbi:MAG: VWA domain-containing protein, partial [Gemmatimonadota bacterium]|nr:VWA domain-containing protein [Gemmatimonadota bacterium]
RAAALAERPAIASLDAMEREVERITRDLLSGEPEHVSANLPTAGSPAASLGWARETASRIRGGAGAQGRMYRGVPPVALWGTIAEGTTAGVARTEEERMRDLLNSASLLNTHVHQEDGASGESGPQGAAGSDEGEPEPGQGGTESDTDPTDETGSLREEIGDGEGAQSGVERTASAPDNNADALLSDIEVLRATTRRRPEPVPDSEATVYPEWDCNARAYRPLGATVRSALSPESAAGAPESILAQYRPIVRSLRQRFERMSARRIQLPRQRDGEELDLAACVRSLIDVRTGHSTDDRLYVDVRPARRALAITLLVDVSGSTGDSISDDRRIIDVERIALLLASEALDALGDRYSILTFSSHGASDVRVAAIKTFAEKNGETVRRRITAIEPHGKTRLGAAVRHASAQLVRQAVNHRILLILSDGKPNDTDRYFEHYAAEDTRQAILEAKTAGVYPFCLTVDRNEGSEYLGHIFGTAGHTILRQPEQLPFALLKGMQHLIAS